MPLSVSDGLSAWIKDFMKSDAPQFKGKTKEEIVKMAIAAYTDAGGKLKKEGKMKNFKAIREQLNKVIRVSEEKSLLEGTWAIPNSYEKMYELQFKYLSKKMPGTKSNAKKYANNLYDLFGDDMFFDDLYEIEKNPNPKVDLRDILVKHLENWNIKFKKTGTEIIIIRAPKSWWEKEEVEETAKRRKSGNIKPIGLGTPVKGKLMGEEVNEKYRSRFPSALVAAAVKIAIDMGGNMTGAYKKIEAMKRGLANDPMVKDALRQANESVDEGTVKEGTWDIPDTKTKLQKLMDLVSKPFFGTTEKDVDKYLKIMPFGDDELYDDLASLYFIPGSTKSKKFTKTDLNQVAMDSLNGRWLTAKKKGNGWDITHINFDVDMEETIKRKYGNLRPGKRMKLDF